MTQTRSDRIAHKPRIGIRVTVLPGIQSPYSIVTQISSDRIAHKPRVGIRVTVLPGIQRPQ